MTESPLKYVECAVTLEEVPTEISLTISISNCVYRCPGCHSPHLQQDVGDPLQRDLDALISRYEGLITCVCLMGEGRNAKEQKEALQCIRARGLKTCLYTGCGYKEPFQNLFSLLDFIKLGQYDQQLGGLDSPTTNQRFYRIESGTLIDETKRFQGKKD